MSYCIGECSLNGVLAEWDERTVDMALPFFVPERRAVWHDVNDRTPGRKALLVLADGEPVLAEFHSGNFWVGGCLIQTDDYLELEVFVPDREIYEALVSGPGYASPTGNSLQWVLEPVISQEASFNAVHTA